VICYSGGWYLLRVLVPWLCYHDDIGLLFVGTLMPLAIPYVGVAIMSVAIFLGGVIVIWLRPKKPEKNTSQTPHPN
jgi:hypothetical protein